MWVAKFKLHHDDCPIVTRAKKYGVTAFSYPSTTYQKNGHTHVSQICKVFGEEQSKLDYVLDLRKDPHLTKFEMPEKDVFTYEFKLDEGEQYTQLYFNNGLMLVGPPVNSPDNFEYWEVASWDKSRITQFHNDLSEHMDSTELIRVSNKKLRNVYFPNVLPALSPSQQNAFELAYRHGYYEFPRKVSLQRLAQLAQVKVATFREHLRKAENKLVPVLSEKIWNPEDN